MSTSSSHLENSFFLIRSVDKFTSGVEGSGKQLIVTAHWLVKTSTYGLEIAHQSDLTLNLIASEEHAITPDRQLGGLHFLYLRTHLSTHQFTRFSDFPVATYSFHVHPFTCHSLRMNAVCNAFAGVQYVRIEVRVQSGRGAARVFHIRLNSLDFTALRDRLTSPINNARAVLVHSSVADRFVDVFLQQVDLNPPYVLPPNMVYSTLLSTFHLFLIIILLLILMHREYCDSVNV